MVRPRILAMDTRDDRVQILTLLARLSPKDRFAWLEWCCAAATLPGSAIRPGVQAKTKELARLAMRDDSAGERLTVECYTDFLMLAFQYKFDVDRGVLELESRVRRAARPGTR